MRFLFVILVLGCWSLASCGFDDVLKKLATQMSADKALNWLLSKRDENWGWEGSSTPDAILAIQLTNQSWFSKENLESQLSGKQLELETALALWSRRHENPIRPGRVAKMINALIAVCQDPKSFYGHDLVAMLEHLDTSHPFEYTYVMMTLCNAGIHVRKKQVKRLYSFVDSEEGHNHDTLAMTVLTMGCVVREHHHRNLLNYLRKHIKRLKKLQHEDGSFGNIHTSSLATQALISVGEDHQQDWNFTKAIEYFLSQQQPDGSFGNMVATMSVMPILVGRSYAHVSNLTCSRYDDYPPTMPPPSVSSRDSDTTDSLSNEVLQAPHLGLQALPETPKTVSVKYSLWIGNNITDNYTAIITVPANTSFYEIMKKAAEENEKFEFSASLWPNGHYVHTLAGLKEDRVENQYWLLCLTNNGPENPVFVDTGVDDFYPKDGESISFWYKKI